MPANCLAYHLVENEDLFSSLIYLTTGTLSAFTDVFFGKLIFDRIRRRKFYRFFLQKIVFICEQPSTMFAYFFCQLVPPVDENRVMFHG